MIHRRDRRTRLADVARIASRDGAALIDGCGEGASLAVGHDLVFLPEFASKLRPRFLERVYTAAEIARADEAFDRTTYFASRWAAKEAAHKAFCDLTAALGAPQDGLACFRQYEITRRDGLAVPALVLHDRAAQIVDDLAREADVRVSLSLTDEREYAAAFVVIACVPRRARQRVPA